MKGILGTVLALIGVVLAILALVGPWWVVNVDASFAGQTIKGVAEFRPFGASASLQTPAGSVTNTTDYKSSPHTGSVFLAGAALVALGIVFGALQVVVGFASKSMPRLRRIGAAMGILAFLVVLLAAVYVMASLPDAVNRDGNATALGGASVSGFWGSRSVSVLGITATVSWAASWAWYVVLVAAIVFLIGGAVAFRPTPSPQTPPIPAPMAEPPMGPPRSP